MRLLGLLLLLTVVVSLSGCGGGNSLNVPVETGQRAASLSRVVNLQLEYLLYLPDSYNEKEAWPLMVFLHGAGERGSDLERVKMHGPAKQAEANGDMPFIIVSPQCPADKWWPGLSSNVLALIDEMVEKYNVDQSRIYLTGLSMGGYGTWSIANDDPGRFAAIAPICGGGHPITAKRIKDIPVWAFHGAKDSVVPLKGSVGMVEAVNKAGGNAKLTVYPEAGHDSWTETYNNDELYKWLLSHSK